MEPTTTSTIGSVIAAHPQMAIFTFAWLSFVIGGMLGWYSCRATTISDPPRFSNGGIVPIKPGEEATMWHEGTRSFYRVRVIHPMTMGDFNAEVDACAQGSFAGVEENMRKAVKSLDEMNRG